MSSYRLLGMEKNLPPNTAVGALKNATALGLDDGVDR